MGRSGGVTLEWPGIADEYLRWFCEESLRTLGAEESILIKDEDGVPFVYIQKNKPNLSESGSSSGIVPAIN
jgi:hypothetical protein